MLLLALPYVFIQQADDKPNGELTCTVAYVQSKGYLEVNGMYCYAHNMHEPQLRYIFFVAVIKGTNLPVMDIGGKFTMHIVICAI